MLLCLKGVFYFKAVRAIVNKFEPIRHKYTMFVWVWPILMIIYSVDLTIFKGPGGLRNDNAFMHVSRFKSWPGQSGLFIGTVEF